MVDAFMRVTSSKGWYYFWLVYSFAFMIVNVLTGSYIFAVFLLLLAIFCAYRIGQINRGENELYNQYHRVEK